MRSVISSQGLQSNVIAFCLIWVLSYASARSADQAGGTNKIAPAVVTASHAGLTNSQAYHLRAGGPSSFVGLTNSPASNHVSLAFAELSDYGPIFRFTNREPHAILLWDVRIQVPSKGTGTDGFGWDTVYDDYPEGTSGNNSASFAPGSTGEFRVPRQKQIPWRVCILYSIDWTDSGKTHSGNYEVISKEMR